MTEFTVYVTLDRRGNIPSPSMDLLKKCCEGLSGCSLRLVWLHPPKKVRGRTISKLVSFQRAHCTHKQLVVHNAIAADHPTASALAGFRMKKYKFTFAQPREQSLEHDYVRMAFGNKPVSCNFNSCLGNCLFIDASGRAGFCPFVQNHVQLNLCHDMDCVYDIFETSEFAQLLKKTIEQRNICKGGCQYFSMCKGGCPLSGEARSPEGCSIRENILSMEEQLGKQGMSDPLFHRQAMEKISEMYRVSL